MVSSLNKELLRSFVVGSSFPAFVILFVAVTYFIKIEKTGLIRYHRYSVLAPVWLGIFSFLAKYISVRYRIHLQSSYLIMSLLSALLVSIMITVQKTYTFSMNSCRGYFQYVILLTGHLLIYNCIIYPLDIYLSSRHVK